LKRGIFRAPAVLIFGFLCVLAACGGTSSPTSPSSSTPALTSTGVTTYTYTTDIRPITTSDCIRCHNPSQHDGGYDFTTYAGIRRAVTPGNANSIFVRVVQPGGSMYGNLSGNRTQKAQVIVDWVVSSGAAE
jgi:hypothetical protein